ncbi:MAG: hypothetical protein A3B90_02465 [Candidatus Magasanikbacteria bacterium RIFCSPHIGHO2_02_FULL_41_13]|uniref:Uncharacterized protein n=1 Tax=Candidatus Magasanikbacteria bacterium RIFCSPHIGHO2_02_FULL_41_13 TaxID=1798676 RepID=A0A1F6M4Z1_9BACT|nr:MAG: hypothetical protein A3B90_02465 [Candidatus Magasanikbacteria bacterium RIFCSPHIGHO2_02_FULL_41_13]
MKLTNAIGNHIANLLTVDEVLLANHEAGKLSSNESWCEKQFEKINARGRCAFILALFLI